MVSPQFGHLKSYVGISPPAFPSWVSCVRCQELNLGLAEVVTYQRACCYLVDRCCTKLRLERCHNCRVNAVEVNLL